jgi:hypothetical protein
VRKKEKRVVTLRQQERPTTSFRAFLRAAWGLFSLVFKSQQEKGTSTNLYAPLFGSLSTFQEKTVAHSFEAAAVFIF